MVKLQECQIFNTFFSGYNFRRWLLPGYWRCRGDQFGALVPEEVASLVPAAKPGAPEASEAGNQFGSGSLPDQSRRPDNSLSRSPFWISRIEARASFDRFVC